MKRTLPAYVYPKGLKGYLYFTRPSTTRMFCTPGTPEFAAEYAKLLAGEPPTTAQSVKALVVSYKKSRRYLDLAPRTRADYNQILGFIVDKFGEHRADSVRRRHVEDASRANADRRRFANYIIQVMSIIMEHAISLGWRTDNPAKGAAYLKKTTPDRKPWPADKIAAFRATATGRALLVFELCLGTGQRIGDVLKMQWSDVQDGGINVRQGKTKASLWIPITPTLQAILDQTPRHGMTICAQANSKPTSYRGAADLVMKVRRQIGAEAYSVHDLRHTAASELAAAGCSDELIMSVTGHKSRGMVAHYAGEARQKARAKEAMGRRK